ncbi:hypothetical protein GHT06_021599 [Daphnia sinensis]|uniref:Uncharacterized protein n=1 Tax=Daphnia sinensis TaxID=1820382 RepID=A0AAD5KKL8_9CRUS|nr:hypothetical protein GHT06_021599 [Daphnia sinensis]
MSIDQANQPNICEDEAGRREPNTVVEEPSAISIPGLGGPANQPKPRVLATSFFGYVPDAFSIKSPLVSLERSQQPPPAADKKPVMTTNKQAKEEVSDYEEAPKTFETIATLSSDYSQVVYCKFILFFFLLILKTIQGCQKEND